MRDLGAPVADPYAVVDRTTARGLLERRLLLASDEVPIERIAASDLARRIFEWRVTLYERGAYPGEWSYRAEVAPDGTLTSLQARVEPDAEIAVDRAGGGDRAGGRLPARRRLRPRPLRTAGGAQPQLQARTDLELRYRSREAVLGDRLRYGLAVHFAGDRLTGFDSFHEDPDERALQPTSRASGSGTRPTSSASTCSRSPWRWSSCAATTPARSGSAGRVHLFALAFGAGVVAVSLVARSMTEGPAWGMFTRQQQHLGLGLQFSILFFFPIALVTFLSWSVGECLSRERMGGKLAAFDSLFKGEWDNATVARSSLRGLAAGIVLLGAAAWGWRCAPTGSACGPRSPSCSTTCGSRARCPGLSLLGVSLLIVLYRELFGRLFLVPLATRRLGTAAGVAAVTLVTGLFLFPAYAVLPLGWALALGPGPGRRRWSACSSSTTCSRCCSPRPRSRSAWGRCR